MTQAIATDKASKFIWQPLLFLSVLSYLIAEVYFTTAMVNTLDKGVRSSDFTLMEHLGRIISGAGIGLSVIIALSLNKRLIKQTRAKRYTLNMLIFMTCTASGYYLVKSVYEAIEANTSRHIIHCSVLGNAAIRVLDTGQLPGFSGYGKDASQNNHFQRQLMRLYLPLHICIDDQYRRQLQTSDVMRRELTTMVVETGLPAKITKPALHIYHSFREHLPRFSAEVEQLQRRHDLGLDIFSQRNQFITNLKQQLSSQSRFTRTDVERIVAVYACALDTSVVRAETGIYEQRFMVGITDCLYDRARARFKTLPGVQRGTDIYQLEQAIAVDWARQFILSPANMPSQAFDLMRESFALVFLPSYVVMVSTFVFFVCLASYLRTRFLIRADIMQKRVNPVINACLSPLVVIPALWTFVFIGVSESELEQELFPVRTQSDWVKVLKVSIRPLLHYYEYSHSGFASLAVPLTLAPKIFTATERLEQRIARENNLALHALRGYYIGELCLQGCEPVILDLKDGRAEYASVRYPNRDCDNRLVYDKSSLEDMVFYESSKSKHGCRSSGTWQLNPVKAGVRVNISDKTGQSAVVLKNLYI